MKIGILTFHCSKKYGALFQAYALISDKVNIWREIQEMHAGLVNTDTLVGTKELIQAWLNLSDEQQQIMQKNTVICFEQKFDVAQAAKNIVSVLNEHTGVKDE